MSFSPYPKYKDSSVEWLGEVPEHWNTVALKRVGTIRYGIGEPPAYHLEGTPLIRATNVHAGRLFEDGLVYVDPDEIPQQRIVWLNAGDIIVVRSGAYTGDSAIIPDTLRKSIAGFDMVLKLQKAHPPFVQFALLSSYLKERQIDLEKMRAAQPHLNAEELGACIVILPTAEEQTTIAAFLDRETAKIDELVAEQRRLIELLKEKRQAVISHAVTKGLNKNAKLKPSGIEWLGDVPERWEISALKRFCELITDGAHVSPETEGGVFSFVSTKDVSGTGIDFNDCLKTSPESYEYLVRNGCKPLVGDVLFSKDGTIGRTVVVTEDREFVVASSLIIIRPDDDLLDASYLHHACQSQFVIEQVEMFVKGAGLPRLSIQNLRKVSVCVPPRREQEKIATYVASVCAEFDTLTAEAERAIELLQERRTALISAAVTGKIDVRGISDGAETGA